MDQFADCPQTYPQKLWAKEYLYFMLNIWYAKRSILVK